MSKRQGLMLIGIWVLILAAPGFPPSWQTILLLVTGLGLIVFGYRMKPSEGSAEKKDLPFTDYKRPQNQAQAPSTDNAGPVA